ncbi:MAG: hypothetical protein JW999_08160, partial [Methanotrichaceae archaeon]|nr:hypothetical protein [Methanotrichaceae archaeon]
MTEGAYVHFLGRYILVQRCGPTVKRIYFSDERPAETLGLAEEIVAHLECGTPCPKAKLDLSICTEFDMKMGLTHTYATAISEVHALTTEYPAF